MTHKTLSTALLALAPATPAATGGHCEFAFTGGSLKLRGADAAPMRPVALPII